MAGRKCSMPVTAEFRMVTYVCELPCLEHAKQVVRIVSGKDTMEKLQEFRHRIKVLSSYREVQPFSIKGLRKCPRGIRGRKCSKSVLGRIDVVSIGPRCIGSERTFDSFEKQ